MVEVERCGNRRDLELQRTLDQQIMFCGAQFFNSVRGVQACRILSRDLELHFLHVTRAAKSSIRARYMACPLLTGPLCFRVLLPVNWADRTMKNMAGRKRNSAEAIVRKLRRADELTAAGKTQEQIAAELEVSAATLYNWRRQYGGMDTDAAKELKDLREQNGRLKRLLADAELEKDALREVARGKF